MEKTPLTMEQEIQKLIREMRRDAVYIRWDEGGSRVADAYESLAMDLERILNKHDVVVQPVRGYPAGIGWNISSPWRYVFNHSSW